MGRKTTIASPFALYAVRLTLGAIVAINVALVAALLSLGARYPALVSPGLLALGFGLRHGVDCDHIAAIDNVAWRLAGLGRPAALVGLWFSLGHSTMVVGLCGVVAGGSAYVRDNVGALTAGATVSAAFSAVMLSTLGVVNLASIGPQFREWRAAARGEAEPHGHGSGGHWKMYVVGVLFGLGFETASEVGLLALAAVGPKDVPAPVVMLLPALFTSGMALVDTCDGLLVLLTFAKAGDGEDRAGALLFGLLLTAASAAAQTLVAAGGSVAIAVAYGTGSQFHALAIVGISFMGAVACAVHASAREAADEARWWSLQCRRFELDPAGGFLPVPSPGEVELEEEFAPWERLGGRLATLNASGTLRRYVAEHVPLVDAGKLLDIEPFPKRVAALRRAYVILGLAVHSYAYRADADWGGAVDGVDDDESKAFDVDADDLARRPVIPKQLAVPWVRVCRELDLPDGAIAACGTDLWNYKGPDAATGPRFLTDAGRERDRAMKAAAEKQKRYGARQILTPRFLWGSSAEDPRRAAPAPALAPSRPWTSSRP
ncbi:high-affinity nickel-transport protein [Aureococcus anophagefferens]|nr:high-affinity nickel-transport protein [Aureococcus anophagefferens]